MAELMKEAMLGYEASEEKLYDGGGDRDDGLRRRSRRWSAEDDDV